jgi:hypothetical protein
MVKKIDKSSDSKAKTEMNELTDDLPHDESSARVVSGCPDPDWLSRGMEICHGPVIPFTREKVTDNSRDVSGRGSMSQKMNVALNLLPPPGKVRRGRPPSTCHSAFGLEPKGGMVVTTGDGDGESDEPVPTRIFAAHISAVHVSDSTVTVTPFVVELLFTLNVLTRGCAGGWYSYGGITPSRYGTGLTDAAIFSSASRDTEPERL